MGRGYLIALTLTVILGDFLHPCSYMLQSVVVDVANEKTVTIIEQGEQQQQQQTDHGAAAPAAEEQDGSNTQKEEEVPEQQQQAEPTKGANQEGTSQPANDKRRPASEVPLEELEQAFHVERFRQLNQTAESDMLVWLASNTSDRTRCAKFLENFDYHRIRELPQERFLETKELPVHPKKYKYIYADSKEGGICHAAKAWHNFKANYPNETYPHVLFWGFHEDWGGMNAKYSTRAFRRHGCKNWGYITSYVNSDDMKAAFTLQAHRLDHPKIHSYALGYRFEKHAHTILNVFHTLNPHDKKSKMMMFNNNIGHAPESRRACLKTLQNNLQSVTTIKNTFDKKWGLTDYYNEMHQSMFIASPEGVGLDCYRNYEAAFMGAIPIIRPQKKPDGWRRTLDDLPVAWIDEWKNVTPQWIETTYRQIYERHYEKPYNWKKLTKSWWVNYIKSFVGENDPTVLNGDGTVVSYTHPQTMDS